MVYLPEALGDSKKIIKEPFENALKLDVLSTGKQCGVIRKIIPREVVQEANEASTGAEPYLIPETGGPLLEDYQRIAHVLVNHNGGLYQPGVLNLQRMLDSITAPGPVLAICNSAASWRLVRRPAP
jgi:hypothetical protein